MLNEVAAVFPPVAETALTRALRDCRELLNAVVAMSSDWYWETDEQYRFTLIETPAHMQNTVDIDLFLGKTWWDLGSYPVQGSWDDHRAQLDARQPFSEFLLCYQYGDTNIHYLVNAGQPRFDNSGRCCGYRGLSKDITTYWRGDQLLRLEHAVTRHLATADSVETAMRGVMRIISESEGWTSAVFFRPTADALCIEHYWVSPDANAAIDELHRSGHGVLLPITDDIPGTAYREKRLVWVADIAAQPHSLQRDIFLEVGLRGSLGLPIVLQDQVVGILGFGSAAIREPDDRFTQAMTIIGSQIAQFMQRKQSEQVLRANEERFRSLTEFSSDWYWEQDENYCFTDLAGREIGDNLDRFLGRTHWDPCFRSEPVGITWEQHRARLDSRQSFRDLILKNVLRDGSSLYYSVSGRPTFDADGRFSGYLGLGKDVTEQKLADERIRYLARHDGLTSLPNRSMFSEMLNLAIHNAQRYQHQLAVLFIDLDRFKNINDTLGHGAGDQLLQEMARRLTETLRAGDLVARLGGDEFVVLLPEIQQSSDAAVAARKILSALTRPLVLQDQECRVTASIGISQFPADAADEHALMKNADIAMYRAKEEGKNNFQFYSESLKTQSLERLALESSLRRALERNEFLLHYQAKRDLRSGCITGVEALLRWQHPDLGMVSPAQFIPLAEETGLIVPIGKWVLQTACEQNMAWRAAGLPELCLAVNLSARQFADENLLDDIAAALAQTGMPPHLLELELTESMVMQNHARAVTLLSAIKAMGVRLAIDDFGVGYSSLAQIKNFPIDTLKVDRSFIRDLPENVEDRAITQAIIAMGKTLSLTVVAEGVETEAQEAFLRASSCDETQGFYFSRPISAEQFGELLGAYVPPCALEEKRRERLAG